MFRHYERVIPRDFFNEAILLKCLGRFELLIDAGKGAEWKVTTHFDGDEFVIMKDDSSGSLTCSNYLVLVGSVQIDLSTPLNCKDGHPLLFEYNSNDGGEVFNGDQTDFSAEFKAFLSTLKPMDQGQDQ